MRKVRRSRGLHSQLLLNSCKRSHRVKRLAERCAGWWWGVYEHKYMPVQREQPYRAVRLRTMLHGPNPNGTPPNAWGEASHLYMLREILYSARYGMPGQIGQLF